LRRDGCALGAALYAVFFIAVRQVSAIIGVPVSLHPNRIFDAQDPGASGPEFLSSHRRRVIFAWIIGWADPYRYTLTLLIAWLLTFVVATLFVCLIDGLS
jgi:hypothetical protein